MPTLWKKTKSAFYLAYIDSSFMINMCCFLFIALRTEYGFSFEQLGRLYMINFVIQIMMDIIGGAVAHRVSVRGMLKAAAACTFFGYIAYAVLPHLISPYSGFVIATVLISCGSGLYEMLLSPLIDAIPSESKQQDMALLHSFYAIGTVFLVVFATAVFFVVGYVVGPGGGLKETFYAGLRYWYILPLCPAVLDVVIFALFCTIRLPEWQEEEKREGLGKVMFQPYAILCALAIFLGCGAELIPTNWTSAFAEKALGYSKFTGDLCGMLVFAVFMSIVRYSFGLKGEKMNLSDFMTACAGITVVLYIVAALSPVPAVSLAACAFSGFTVAMLWPGVLSLAAARFPKVGAPLFAMLACCGDTGGAVFPWLMGFLSDNSRFIHSVFSYVPDITPDGLCLRSGLLLASAVPFCLFVVHAVMRHMSKQTKNE